MKLQHVQSLVDPHAERPSLDYHGEVNLEIENGVNGGVLAMGSTHTASEFNNYFN